MSTNKRVAIYARVSTKNEGQDVTLQTNELREYAARAGWQLVGEYVDSGISGSKDSRPELDRLMHAVRGRKVDCVLVWKLDRWGRSLKHLVTSISELEHYGVAFVSVRDQFDLTTPAGKLMFQVIGAMSEFERSLIRERVQSAMSAIKAGTKRTRSGKRVGRPAAAVDLAEVQARRARGESMRAIGRTLGISASVLAKRLAGETRDGLLAAIGDATAVIEESERGLPEPCLATEECRMAGGCPSCM